MKGLQKDKLNKMERFSHSKNNIKFLNVSLNYQKEINKLNCKNQNFSNKIEAFLKPSNVFW